MCERELAESGKEREKGITKMSLSILLDAFASKGCECQTNREGENKRLFCNSLISNSKAAVQKVPLNVMMECYTVGLNFIFR